MSHIKQTPGIDELMQAKVCPYCFAPPELIDSSVVYGGRSFGKLWACLPCRAWVGCHPDTERPLGRLADEGLRRAKMEAHKNFDPLWVLKMKKDKVSKSVARNAAYAWLASQMEISREYFHIGMFNIEQCYQVVNFCAPYYDKLPTRK